ncbi:MAG TPA: hypothetical protein PKE16_02300 [Hyphomicrobium sp.]|nr:hypothetical protein [Hyphomicrobium sp.]
MTDEMKTGRGWRSLKRRIYGGAIFAVSLLTSASAYAVSERVKSACRDDYFQHCSQYAVGSEELRQCMRKVGEDLSTPCLVALVQDGEISKADVERHNAEKTAAPRKKSAVVASDDTVDPKTVSSKETPKHKAGTKLKSAGEKKRTRTAAVTEEAPTSEDTQSAKTHKAKTKTKKVSSKTSHKASAKTKGKKAKATQTLAATSATSENADSAAHSKKSTTGKVKSATKKKSAAKTVKPKKTTKKKSATKHAAKSVNTQSP